MRRTLLYSGRVQGVGFRYTAVEIAADFDIRGTVCNLPDGRVKLVAEGVGDELDRFQAALAQVMQSNIRDVSVSPSAPTGEFDAFRIVR
ncbi:MAG: acylphosphatase [Planctomycetes bacterium]|nr:acylphosphatase [Planctomycetota bacterium]